MTQHAYGSNANDEASILMHNEEHSTITLTPVPTSNKSKVVKGLVALGCVAATVAVAGVKMAETSTTTAMPGLEPMTLQSSNLIGPLMTGAPMAFMMMSSKGLCIDQRADGPDSVVLYAERCDEQAENQVFRFSPADGGRLRPIKNSKLCWTADRESGLLVLDECDKANDAQAIMYDPPTSGFRIRGTNKCLSTFGGGARPVLAFANCDRMAPTQRFALTMRGGRPPKDDGTKKMPDDFKNDDDDEDKGTQAPIKKATIPPPPPPPQRPSGPTQPPRSGPSGLYVLGARGSETECLDPSTAGKTTLFTCKDVAPPQAMRYDGAFLTPMLPPRDRNSPTCIDASNMAAPIQTCTRSPPQAFKLDFKRNMFRNPVANLCIVDKSDVKFDVLVWCDDSGKPLV